MSTNFKQDGDVIQHASVGGVAAGRVVKIGNLLGVSLLDIPANGTGPIKLTGVFAVPKVSGAVITAGESLTWDVSAGSGAGAFDDNAATAAAGDVTGAAAVAWEDAASGVTTMLVKFTGVPGTVA